MTQARRAVRTLAGALLFTVAIGGLAPLVQAAPPADPTARAEELGQDARTAYSAGRFEDAIALYVKAYEIAPTAGFLFNIAFVYDKKLGDAELAAQFYQRVIDTADADPELKEKARAAIAALPKAESRAPSSGAPDGGGAAHGGAGDGDGDAGDARPGDGLPARPPADDGGPGALPWALMGGGGVLLVSGVVIGVLASGTERDFHAATSAKSKASLKSDGESQALAADILMLTGVAVAGTGLLVYLLTGGDDGDTEGRVDVAPAILPGGVGVFVRGSLF